MARRFVGFALCAALAALGCGDDDGADPVDADLTPDASTRGTISFSWSLSDGSGPIDCADVDATTVSITLLPVGVIGSESDAFSCDSGSATTRGLIPREYDLELAVRTTEGDLTERIAMPGITVDPLQDTNIGNIEFTVDPVGNFTFQLRALDTGGNCAAVDPDMGAEITQFQIVLNQGGVCVPTDFEIDAGGMGGTAATYTTTCGDEIFDACIDESQTLTVSDVGSGPTTLDITGFRAGGEPCYVTTSQFNVPGGGLTADNGSISLVVDNTNEVCVPPKMP